METSDRTESWEHAWYDLSPWTGQTVTATFTAHQTANHHYLWAYIDDVTVGSANPDIWADLSAIPPAALPGDQVTYQLRYGNQGYVDTSGVVMTHTLPTSLNFIDASLEPTIVGNSLTWNIGDLPASDGPFTIWVTATVEISVSLGTTIDLPITITTETEELEKGNNVAMGHLFIGKLSFLPLIAK